MTGRLPELDAPPAAPIARFNTVTLVAPPNWTAVCFFAALGALHACIAVPAFVNLRWEGYMSATLSVAFITASVITSRVRSSVSFESAGRRIHLRNGSGRFHFRRTIGFDDVHAVRLTITRYPDHPHARIEVLCDNEDIECPPTDVPRQEALCLAVLLGVQLIKVFPEGVRACDNPEDADEPEPGRL